MMKWSERGLAEKSKCGDEEPTKSVQDAGKKEESKVDKMSKRIKRVCGTAGGAQGEQRTQAWARAASRL